MSDFFGDELRGLVDEQALNEKNIKTTVDFLILSNKKEMKDAAQRGDTTFSLSMGDTEKYVSSLYQNERIVFNYVVETYHLNMRIFQSVDHGKSEITFSWAAPANIKNCDATAER